MFSVGTVWTHFVVIMAFSLLVIPKLLATVNTIIQLLFTVDSKMLSVILFIVVGVVTVFARSPLGGMCFHVLI